MGDKGQDKPIISVVIPTRNRSDLLRDCLESLLAQTLDAKKFEIVICDNQSTDDTADVISEFAARATCPIHYHRMDDNRGPAHARNIGAKRGHADWIAFTDSDCRADPTWLEHAAALIEKNPDMGFATGSVLEKPEQPVRFFTRTIGVVTCEHPTYPTCNSLYRRDVFLEMGGFDENLCYRDFLNRVTECADTDLAWRIKKKGYRNAFDRDMAIYHEVAMQTPYNWMREPFRLWVVPALVRRHPELRRCLLQWRYFFFKENALFYLVVIGLVLALALTPWALLLMLPYAVRATLMGNPTLTLMGIPKLIARVMLFAARQAFICAGLIYGTVRFRTVVL